MAVIVYRGVDYAEALRVIARQSYEREERRTFLAGIKAKAVFGQGVYLVSNPQVAAEYAYCHAVSVWDKGAVLQQRLDTAQMLRLTPSYGENELRQEALQWKYVDGEWQRIYARMTLSEWQEWTGERIREYLQERGYQGIVYPMAEDLTYYVSYQPQKQIEDIAMYACLLHT